MLREETLPLIAGSIEETLKNIIAKHRILDLRTDKPDEFEKSLIKEVLFLALYDINELQGVEKYIREHSSMLYQFALRQKMS
jgi:hypothetical protein